MQTRNKILDDISQLMTNAMGVAQGAKDEAETAMTSMIDRWLADRDFVTREEFDAVMKEANQIARKRQDVSVSAADLLQIPQGAKTEAGLRQNINVGIGYHEAWLPGVGCYEAKAFDLSYFASFRLFGFSGLRLFRSFAS